MVTRYVIYSTLAIYHIFFSFFCSISRSSTEAVAEEEEEEEEEEEKEEKGAAAEEEKEDVGAPLLPTPHEEGKNRETSCVSCAGRRSRSTAPGRSLLALLLLLLLTVSTYRRRRPFTILLLLRPPGDGAHFTKNSENSRFITILLLYIITISL